MALHEQLTETMANQAEEWKKEHGNLDGFSDFWRKAEPEIAVLVREKDREVQAATVSQRQDFSAMPLDELRAKWPEEKKRLGIY